MVEIECEGVELDDATRRTLWGPLRGLVRLVDPEGGRTASARGLDALASP
ncbi:MAG: hypothetical protein KF729_31605 [Sandaracinaceae bacterium]|nr:hypothetical protein [Sandaracinaceae bacterium]